MKNKLIWLGILTVSQLMGWSSPATIATADKNFFPQIVSDGSTGAIISWLHKNSSGCYEVYTCHVDANKNIGSSYTVSVKNNVTIGHRLNHHIVWSVSNAYSFWANHFDVKSPNPEYRRGYYLQKLSSSGAPQWPPVGSKDPVQVLHSYYVPDYEPGAGDPISICPDGSGGCVVAMKATPADRGGLGVPWMIIVNRYNSNGEAQWDEGSDKGTEIYRAGDGGDGEIIGCPKVVRWGTDEFMVVWTSVTDANYTDDDAEDNRINSKTTLHICRIDEDGVVQAHDESIYFEADEAKPIYYNEGPSSYNYCRWYWWIPDFQITTNSSRNELFVVYLKRLKHRWVMGDTPSWKYRADSLYILEYSSPSSKYVKPLDGFSWQGISAHNYNGDWCPFRSPSIICVNNAAIVCTPRSTVNPPRYGNKAEEYPLYMTFHLKIWKMNNGTVTHLWDKDGSNYHTPRLIADPSGGMILAYSKYTTSDYLNSTNSSSAVVERHYPLTQETPNWTKTLNSYNTNTSPQIILSDNNHVIVTWAASDDGVSSSTWRIMAQRYDMSGN